MEIVEDHQSLFDHILGDEIPDDIPICESSDHCDLEELNPPDATEVADFDAEVDSAFTTWVLKSYFYVCAVPDNKSTYLLFAISWDDNWGQWRRESWGAVKGASSHEEATKFLLKKFAEENLEGAPGGEWQQFLEGLLAQ